MKRELHELVLMMKIYVDISGRSWEIYNIVTLSVIHNIYTENR